MGLLIIIGRRYPMKYEELEGAARYSEWRFVYIPAASANRTAPQPAAVPGKD